MKSLTEQLWFETPHRRDYLNITGTVEALVRKSGVQEGLCLVNAMHITASVYINDAEDGLLHDYDVWLEKLAPHAPTSQYQHNRTGEDNADAHMKRQIMGREVVVAITKGKLDLGPWGKRMNSEGAKTRSWMGLGGGLCVRALRLGCLVVQRLFGRASVLASPRIPPNQGSRGHSPSQTYRAIQRPLPCDKPPLINTPKRGANASGYAKISWLLALLLLCAWQRRAGPVF